MTLFLSLTWVLRSVRFSVWPSLTTYTVSSGSLQCSVLLLTFCLEGLSFGKTLFHVYTDCLSLPVTQRLPEDR